MSDYKYEAQLRAEEMAEEETGKDFSDLSMIEQHKLYQRALDDVLDRRVLRAEINEDR